MKKFIVLIFSFIFLFASCNSTKAPENKTTEYTINYSNNNTDFSAAVTSYKDGSINIKFLKPNSLKGLSYSYTLKNETLKYKGLCINLEDYDTYILKKFATALSNLSIKGAALTKEGNGYIYKTNNYTLCFDKDKTLYKFLADNFNIEITKNK